MVSALGAVGALVSLTSLILVAISLATNHWVDIDFPRPANSTSISPSETNSKLGPDIIYDLDYFGLWVGCHRATNFAERKISCAYIRGSCFSDVCWIRNDEDKECVDARVRAIENCPALRATRAMAIIGTIFLITGASITIISVCVVSRNLASSGALCNFLAGFFLMIAFAVFIANIYRNELNEIGSIGYSFILLIVAWPLAIIAAAIGAFASIMAPKQVAEYEDTE